MNFKEIADRATKAQAQYPGSYPLGGLLAELATACETLRLEVAELKAARDRYPSAGGKAT